MEKKLKKIMFNDKYCLTQAVLEGRKTQTRRIINGLPTNMVGMELITIIKSHREYDEQYKVLACHTTDHLGRTINIPYQVGEEVAVAQNYQYAGYSKDQYQEVYYDKPHDVQFDGDDYVSQVSGYVQMPFDKLKGWNNKMFVRADLMPHRIKMTNLNIERLQDISEDDCLKEGIKRKNNRYLVENQKGVCFYTNDARLAFRCLIDKICGKGTWEKNPYVFVYDFELIK